MILKAVLKFLRAVFALVGIHDTLGGWGLAAFLTLWVIAFVEVELESK